MILLGTSLRAAQRKHQVSFNAVMTQFKDTGDMAIAYFEGLKDLECRCMQADELHTYFGTRDRLAPQTGRPTSGMGGVWVYLSIAADSKLVVDFLAGTGEVYDATAFMESLAGKLRRKPNGETDGLPCLQGGNGHRFRYRYGCGHSGKEVGGGPEGAEIFPQPLCWQRQENLDRQPCHG